MELVGLIERATRVHTTRHDPASTPADDTRSTLGAAANTLERAATLDAAPALAGMLDEAAITAAHVDVVTRNTKDLDDRQRRDLIDRCDQLASVAATATPADIRTHHPPRTQPHPGRRRHRPSAALATRHVTAHLGRQRGDVPAGKNPVSG
jgi:hypothetical protein